MAYQRKEFNGFRFLWQLVGILVLLGAIGAVLFPIFAQPTHHHRSVCLSNLKQLSTSVAIYSADSDDLLPPYFSFDSIQAHSKFYDATMPYSKNPYMYLCLEEERNKSKKDYVASIEGIPDRISYVHSLTLKGAISGFAQGKRILNSNDPMLDLAKTLYLRDPIRGFGSANRSKVASYLSQHGATFNVTYLDTHAKALTPISEEL